MSTKLPFDPMSMWKSVYEQTEKNWSQVLQDMMEKEAFSEGMGETLNYYLQYQELVNQMTETYLKEVNIPSRSEVANIASLIINLEEKIDQVNDELDEKFTELNQTKEITQLSDSITKLDKKVSAIIDQVERLNGDNNK